MWTFWTIPGSFWRFCTYVIYLEILILSKYMIYTYANTYMYTKYTSIYDIENILLHTHIYNIYFYIHIRYASKYMYVYKI